MPPKRALAADGTQAPAAKRAARLREWMFTVFQPNVVAAPLALLASLSPQVAYVAFQREVAPGTGRHHLQGYLAMEKPVALTAVKKLLGDPTAHLEPTKGTPEEASAYCTKVDTRDPAPDSGPFVFGVLPKGQGKRSDLLAVQALLDDGASDLVISEKHFGSFVRYNRGFALYRSLRATQRSWQTQAIVYWGPPGSGKTRAAASFDSPEHTFWLPRPSGSGTAWWDGYSGQRTVILDEFYGWLRRDLLQRLIDRTPIRVECKGGSLVFAARTIIFTSNVDPPRWYKNAGLGALERRLADPIGAVVYVGDLAYPTAASYTATLPNIAAPDVHWLQTSDDVAAAAFHAGGGALGAGPGQY